MPPRSSIGKRIVRRPASYEEEPDTDDGEYLGRVIRRTFVLVPKEGPAAIKHEGIIALKMLLFEDAPRAVQMFTWLYCCSLVVILLSNHRFNVAQSYNSRRTRRTR
jgi:hypothetical protein